MTLKKYITPEILIHNIEIAPLCTLSNELDENRTDGGQGGSNVPIANPTEPIPTENARGFSFSWEEDWE